MTETVDGQERKIKICDYHHIRTRPEDSDRVKAELTSKRKKRRNYDKTSFKWLAENYIRKKGLRNWTWKTIIEGIRNEHLHELKAQGDKNEIDDKFVYMIWNMFLKFGGVVDFNKTPVTDDPEHNDVALILTLYSMDTFLF